MDYETHRMPSGATVFYRDSDHQYNETEEFKKAGRIPGISTIAKNDGQPGADGLMDWAARLTCEGVAQEFEVSSNLVGEGDPHAWLRDGPSIETMLKQTHSSWRDIRDQAGDRGTVSHNVLQTLAEGENPLLQSGHDHAVVDWWKKRRPTPVFIEQVVYHHTERFAGRFDLGFNPDHLTFLDLKTGSVRGSALIQLNLYRWAAHAAELGEVKRLLVLDTRDDGSWHEIEVPLNAEWAHAALRIYKLGGDIRRSLTAAKKAAVQTSAPQLLEQAA